MLVDDAEGDDVVPLADVEQADPSFDAAAARRAVAPDDVLTLIYTSGTTGPPKGVQLTHRNLMAAVKTVDDVIQFPDGARVISWLPAAHIAERAAHHYLPIVYAADGHHVPEPARDRRATCPRCARPGSSPCRASGRSSRPASRRCSRPSPTSSASPPGPRCDAAIEKVRLEQRGEPVPEELAAAVAKADEEMFSKLRAMLGLDQVVAVNVGAAPTPRRGARVLPRHRRRRWRELWGMSETCGAGACNPPERVKIGTVGPPTPGVEIKLAEDGEVLIRGRLS